MVNPTHGDPHAPVPGGLIDPWRIEDCVDAGSFGLIYKVLLASDPSAGPFAMKLAAQPGDPRFEREATMLSLVVSPHVPRFHDAGTWNGHPYIVMQWVEGVPLYRGTAAELAQSLEAAAAHGGRKADLPIRPSAAALPTEQTRLRGRQAWRARMLARAAAPFAAMAAVVLFALGGSEFLHGQGPHEVSPPLLAEEWHTPPVETPDAGVGQEALASVQDVPRVGVPTYALGLPMPKAALPGQRKPPCDTSSQVEVLGACWAILAKKPPCGASGYEYEGRCVLAAFPEPRQPTSEQP